MRRPFALLLIVAGGIAMDVAPRILLRSELASLAGPIPVITALDARGLRAFAVFAAGILCWWGVYVLLLRVQTGCSSALAAGALAAAALAAPLLFSSDVYAYAWYGELAARGLNPYIPHAVSGAFPMRAPIVAQWGGVPPRAVYGPLFIALSAAAAAVARGDPGALLWILRLLAVGGFAVTALRLERVRPGAGRRFALNPVVIWSSAEGHNDALALALLTVAAGERRFAARVALAVASAWIKATALVPAVLSGLTSPGSAISWRRTRMPMAAAGAAVALAGYLPLAISLWAAPPVASAVAHVSLEGTAAALALGAGLPPSLALGAGIAVAALAVLVALDAARRTLANGTAGLWSASGLALWFAIPNVYPWYAVWLAAAAAFEWGSPLAGAATVATFASILRYLPDAVTPSAVPVTPLVGLGIFLPPLLALAVASRKLR